MGCLLAASLFASAVGCDSGGDSVYPAALTTANSQRALAIGAVYEMNGSYGAGCIGRQGAWSLALSQVAALTNDPLSVQKDNDSCVLTLESLRIGANEETSAMYVASPPMVLGGSYAAAPSGFLANGAGPAAFFANAAILPDAGFHANFVIQVIFSDDPATSSASKIAESAVALGGSVSIQGVPAPDYTASLDQLTVKTNLAHVVTEGSGSLELTASSQSGESFAVLPFDLGPSPSYAAVDSAFALEYHRLISGLSRSVPWDELVLLGQTLTTPIVRSIVIAHTVAGVRAYQIIRLTISE